MKALLSQPVDPYAISKHEAEVGLMELAEQTGLDSHMSVRLAVGAIKSVLAVAAGDAGRAGGG